MSFKQLTTTLYPAVIKDEMFLQKPQCPLNTSHPKTLPTFKLQNYPPSSEISDSESISSSELFKI